MEDHMGHVQAFNIPQLIADFNLDIYIETGTGIGDSLSHALKHPFKHFYSIEMDKGLYDQAIKLFQHPNLKIINGLSSNILPEILPKIASDTRVLFFLDAHFPEADFGNAPDRYRKSVSKYGKDALPLEEELRIIKNIRIENKDVIIIDDVWVYEDGPFEGGNWSERPFVNSGDMSFVGKIFDDTHFIKKFYRQQGYLFLTPKDNS